MFVLLLLLLVGALLAYVSKNNLMPVSLHLGQYVLSDVPLFYVIVGSLGIGLAVSYLIYIVHDISTSFQLNGKKREISKGKDEVLQLTKRVHQLELENERLKNGGRAEQSDKNAL